MKWDNNEKTLGWTGQQWEDNILFIIFIYAIFNEGKLPSVHSTAFHGGPQYKYNNKMGWNETTFQLCWQSLNYLYFLTQQKMG